MNVTDNIKAFWDNQAREHGGADTATAPDSYYRNLEISRIIEHLPNRGGILDVGCGNGYSTMEFERARPKADIIGVDYSQKMIDEALKNKDTYIAFEVCNVLELSYLLGLYNKLDVIVSERCLINLETWEEQQQALLEMKKCLVPGGKIILVENFVDGLKNLNEWRELMDLPPITMRWHNRYMVKERFVEFACKHFIIEHQENIGNLYYIISRVVYPAFAMECEEGKIRYDHPLNKIASMLPSLGNYEISPNYMFILRKKEGERYD